MIEQKDRPDREKIAKLAFQYAFLIDDKNIKKQWGSVDKKERWYYLAEELIALFPDIEEAKTQERKEHWIDVPNKRGDYWLSPFIDGRYISPRLISVIDYDRPDRGLEVQYDRPGETIPVKLFCDEYYPKAKWMFISEPNWQALKEE